MSIKNRIKKIEKSLPEKKELLPTIEFFEQIARELGAKDYVCTTTFFPDGSYKISHADLSMVWKHYKLIREDNYDKESN